MLSTNAKQGAVLSLAALIAWLLFKEDAAAPQVQPSRPAPVPPTAKPVAPREPVSIVEVIEKEATVSKPTEVEGATEQTTFGKHYVKVWLKPSSGTCEVAFFSDSAYSDPTWPDYMEVLARSAFCVHYAGKYTSRRGNSYRIEGC